VLGVLVWGSVAVVGVVLIDRSSATAGGDPAARPTATIPTPATSASNDSSAPAPPDRLPRDRQRGLSDADGVVPDGVTVFDEVHAAVVKLDPSLLDALRRAATTAARDGVRFDVDSGWRSRAYQEQLLTSAIEKYGSAAEAARWVATPDSSAHVSGEAVDMGRAASTWLARHGSRYGLCQTYRNERWHFELRPDAVVHGCPAMYADPTRDPRMQGST
jgi:hypothetical protein